MEYPKSSSWNLFVENIKDLQQSGYVNTIPLLEEYFSRTSSDVDNIDKRDVLQDALAILIQHAPDVQTQKEYDTLQGEIIRMKAANRPYEWIAAQTSSSWNDKVPGFIDAYVRGQRKNLEPLDRFKAIKPPITPDLEKFYRAYFTTENAHPGIDREKTILQYLKTGDSSLFTRQDGARAIIESTDRKKVLFALAKKWEYLAQTKGENIISLEDVLANPFVRDTGFDLKDLNWNYIEKMIPSISSSMLEEDRATKPMDVRNLFVHRSVDSKAQLLKNPSPSNTANSDDYYQTAEAIVSGSSRIGSVKKEQADSYLAMESPKLEGHHLLAVADGLPHTESREYASHMLMDTLKDWYEGVDIDTLQDINALQNGMKSTILKVANKLEQTGNYSATTLSLALVAGDKTILYNIGNSRIYLETDGQLIQVSKDNTLAYNEWQTQPYPASKGDLRFATEKVLTNAINRKTTEDSLGKCEVIFTDSYRGILLATDGVTGVLTDDNMKYIMDKSSPQEVASRLTERATDGSTVFGHYDRTDTRILRGKDNSTIVQFVKPLTKESSAKEM